MGIKKERDHFWSQSIKIKMLCESENAVAHKATRVQKLGGN